MYSALHNLTSEDFKTLQNLLPNKKDHLFDKLTYAINEIDPPTKEGKLSKPFPITSVARADIVSQDINGKIMTEKDVLKIEDDDMERIAEEMADAYTGGDIFWIDLPIIVEAVLK